MAECRALCVDPQQINQFWPHVSSLIKRAMKRGGLSEFSAVEHSLFNGGALLWVAWDGTEIKGAAVTELATTSGKRFCTIVACGGNKLDQWQHLIGELEAYARREGCATTKILGRTGWGRLLTDYHVKAVILEKEL